MKASSRPNRGAPDANAPSRSEFEPTVLAWRPLSEWGDVCGQVIRSDANVAEILFGFVRETAAAAGDEPRLLEVIREFAFRAFPNASHMVLAECDDAGELRTRITRSRDAGDVPVQLSRTITDRVMREHCALLYVQEQERHGHSQSVVLTRLETAICAPLVASGVVRGVLQLDVRRPARGRFTREDVDLLSVIASQVGLVLEHRREAQQQQRAFESTTGALVDLLAHRAPDNVAHAERVGALAMAIGRQMGYGGAALQALGWVARVHDLGLHGLHHQGAIRPDRIGPAKREELARRAASTQAILDAIVYPEALRGVNDILAGLDAAPTPADGDDAANTDARTLAGIVRLADVCDALLAPGAGGTALVPGMVLDAVVRGRGKDWDPRVVDATCTSFPRLLAEVYGGRLSASETSSGLDVDRKTRKSA